MLPDFLFCLRHSCTVLRIFCATEKSGPNLFTQIKKGFPVFLLKDHRRNFLRELYVSSELKVIGKVVQNNTNVFSHWHQHIKENFFFPKSLQFRRVQTDRFAVNKILLGNRKSIVYIAREGRQRIGKSVLRFEICISEYY